MTLQELMPTLPEAKEAQGHVAHAHKPPCAPALSPLLTELLVEAGQRLTTTPYEAWKARIEEPWRSMSADACLDAIVKRLAARRACCICGDSVCSWANESPGLRYEIVTGAMAERRHRAMAAIRTL